MRRGMIVGGRKSGLLLDLADDAAGNIEPAANDIVEIGRAGGKIDAPRVGGVRPHLAKHESAVRTAQRTHAKAVEDFVIRTPPIAPGEETGEIGFEIMCRKMRAVEQRPAAEQDAAVPQFRFLALLFGKKRPDLLPAGLR